MELPAPAPAPSHHDDEPADVAVLARLLAQAGAGGEPADTLFAALYRELHRLARRELHRNAGGLTLGATTLLHETYLDLRGRGLDFPDRARFFAYAARAMRGLIVDHARSRRALKRGGEYHFTSLDSTGAPEAVAPEDLGPLSDALDVLVRAEPALAELVELKVFCGLSLGEIAAMRGVTERTTQRHWDKARLFLRQALG
jgi:RNA polymerase sigma factor (TIGR02999 family)